MLDNMKESEHLEPWRRELVATAKETLQLGPREPAKLRGPPTCRVGLGEVLRPGFLGFCGVEWAPSVEIGEFFGDGGMCLIPRACEEAPRPRPNKFGAPFIGTSGKEVEDAGQFAPAQPRIKRSRRLASPQRRSVCKEFIHACPSTVVIGTENELRIIIYGFANISSSFVVGADARYSGSKVFCE